ADFYRQVIGWSEREVGGRQEMLREDGGRAAGIGAPTVGAEDVPPVWLIHLPVGDLPESVRRAEAEGGAVIGRGRGDDGAQVWAVVRDPVGVCFALVQG